MRLSKDELLALVKVAVQQNTQPTKVQKFVKAQARVVATLIKKAKLEKQAFSPELIRTIIAWGPTLIRALGGVGRKFGISTLARGSKAIPISFARAGRGLMKGLGSGLSRIGLTRPAQWLSSRARPMGHFFGRMPSRASSLAIGSYLLPPEWIGFGEREMPTEVAEESPILKATQEAGYMLPPNPYRV